ncbi:MAG: SEL1-like repeat protein, partial [Opitutales bacterium]|nr:SEL1-like repeat protein [Opitutales bacterium]
RGNSPAALHLHAQCLLQGRDAPRDVSAAVRLLRRAARSAKAGGLLFSKAEVEAFNEIASHIGHQPFDLAALPTG